VQDIDLSPATAAPAAVAQPTADPAIVAYNEGANLANEGKDAEAIAKIEEAVTLKPDLTTGHETLARLYLRTKAYDKAIAAANKVLAVDTDNTDMNAVLFDSYNAKGDKTKAAEYKAKVPANAGVTYNEAVPLLNAGKYKEAEVLLKQVIQIDPKFAVAYYQLGIIGMQKGDNDAAKANFQKYLELDPNGKDADVAKEALKSLK
jgi:superkiller protein 3